MKRREPEHEEERQDRPTPQRELPRPGAPLHNRGRKSDHACDEQPQIRRADVEELVDLVAAVEDGRRAGCPVVVDDHALPEVAECAPIRDEQREHGSERARDGEREPPPPFGSVEQEDEHDGRDQDGGQLDAHGGDGRGACKRREDELAAPAPGGEGREPCRDERDPETRQVGPHACGVRRAQEGRSTRSAGAIRAAEPAPRPRASARTPAVPSRASPMKASRTCSGLGPGDRAGEPEKIVEARRLGGEDLGTERLAVAEGVEAREVEALVEVHARVAQASEQDDLRSDDEREAAGISQRWNRGGRRGA